MVHIYIYYYDYYYYYSYYYNYNYIYIHTYITILIGVISQLMKVTIVLSISSSPPSVRMGFLAQGSDGHKKLCNLLLSFTGNRLCRAFCMESRAIHGKMMLPRLQMIQFFLPFSIETYGLFGDPPF